MFTYRTRLSVTRLVVHGVSSTRLPTMLRGRVQTLPLTTLQASTTRLGAQRPLGPARPASGNYTQTHHTNTCESRTAPPVCVCIPRAVHSPGQSVLLQACVSPALPVHPLPPFCAGGLLQRRTRVMLPAPHVVVHADQGDQRPQFPSARTRHDT